MKSFLKIFLRTSILFGVITGLIHSLLSGPAYGIPMGIFGGIFFGLAIAAVAAYFENKAQNWTPDMPGETVVKRSAGSHFVNGVAVGGYFYLTDKQLHFRPHGLNLKGAKPMSIPIALISGTEKNDRLGVLPDQLKLLRTDGTAERLVLEEVDEWEEEINNTRRKYLEDHRSEDQRLFS